MQSGNLEYRGADGKRYVGFLVRPDKPSGAAVVIAHSAFGLADHERDFATRLAQSGYIVLAADYHGDGELLPVETMMTRIGPVLADPSLVRPAMLAALNALRAQDGVDSERIVSAGFCFGGAAVFELACTGEDVKAAVGFHSSLPTNRPEDAKAIKGAILMLQGDFVTESAHIETLDPEFEGMPIARSRIDNAGITTVLSNSFGFGGTNATLVLQRHTA